MATIGDYIRQQREQAKISLRQLADQAGVSNPYLSQIERGLRKPSADILQQIAKGLRISAEALYVQAGILEAPQGSPDLTRAIMADQRISEDQKQALVRIYLAFRRDYEDEHREQREPGAKDAAAADGRDGGVGAGAETPPSDHVVTAH